MVAVLLEACAYINPMESNGGRLTPLDYAMINNHSEVAHMLVSFQSWFCLFVYLFSVALHHINL